MRKINTGIYKDGICLFGINMFASMLNYICQILMARILSVESFGEINAIFSYLLIIGVPCLLYTSKKNLKDISQEN